MATSDDNEICHHEQNDPTGVRLNREKFHFDIL